MRFQPACLRRRPRALLPTLGADHLALNGLSCFGGVLVLRGLLADLLAGSRDTGGAAGRGLAEPADHHDPGVVVDPVGVAAGRGPSVQGGEETAQVVLRIGAAREPAVGCWRGEVGSDQDRAGYARLWGSRSRSAHPTCGNGHVTGRA
ncbi:hypothetical protein GCM10010174_51840 [Kutzneria viridogrisea]|uniref:Uncharacterized protein n=1 Tax=Kutzneria viridogrisea TaxID=47990 RepID=A0ABR6BAV2_9PSEU|nr:hypothetical protein [Kutzneria viridogrisea]